MSAPSDALRLSNDVFAALHEEEPIYAVLDGAKNEKIHRWATTDAKAPAWCLYRGKLKPDIAAVAPYLLRLGRGHGHSEQFFSEGWNQSWGVLLSSAAPSRELRQHLRKYLKVLTEDNRGMLFRWYDPRVLRLYLPTCTPAELKHFFGPVTAFAAAGPTPSSFNLYRLGAAGLEHRVIQT